MHLSLAALARLVASCVGGHRYRGQVAAAVVADLRACFESVKLLLFFPVKVARICQPAQDAVLPREVRSWVPARVVPTYHPAPHRSFTVLVCGEWEPTIAER